MVVAICGRTAVHAAGSGRSGVDGFTDPDRLLPRWLEGAHAANPAGMVGTELRAVGGVEMGFADGTVFEVDGSRGPGAPNSSDGTPRNQHFRIHGSSDAGNSPPATLTRGDHLPHW